MRKSLFDALLPQALGVLGIAEDGQRGSNMIRGHGDGMSDSIPAVISGNPNQIPEPIRVTDGEYIIPADVVSHIGNGSSEAGAKQLDRMVAEIRHARTGTTRQAPEIKPGNFLP